MLIIYFKLAVKGATVTMIFITMDMKETVLAVISVMRVGLHKIYPGNAPAIVLSTNMLMIPNVDVFPIVMANSGNTQITRSRSV